MVELKIKMTNFETHQNLVTTMKRLTLITLFLVFCFACKDDKKEVILDENNNTFEQPDMAKNLSKYVKIKLTADLSKLSANEREMIPYLIEAANIMNDLFWYEAYGDRSELLKSIEDQKTKRFVENSVVDQMKFNSCCSEI